jgi:nucleoid-associated protein YgaU
MFFKGSRYERVPDDIFTAADGRVIRYKTVRFIAESAASVGHRVVQGERLDHIAHRYYRDSQRFWRICDANVAMSPADVLEEGEVILIPPAES